ncbi:acyl-CoA dehydrogenase NM domain-like protein [Rhodocollybia butyracea]|uniref:Acyl-CoA dehydrogenase NM domain-like protein n=1 Tax=Rhodocollybia butyracea TaxID=206335 RepID=A0A9P5Q6B6_9AGAR|nr:acyl-CoA dehydrogenase NM domain-like protein [Rhodocollybia butyracea]
MTGTQTTRYPATLHLATSPLFRKQDDGLSVVERTIIAYRRAEAIGVAYDLSTSDLLNLTPKFWKMHEDPIMVMDGAATTLFTTQYNLVVGTIAQYARGRRDLDGLLDDLLKYRKIGQFCLTELGHGLDAANLETTAVMLSDGGFVLHTPHLQASKYMPPTGPMLGKPCVGIVFARLLVAGDDHGVRAFVPGITTRVLPSRGGTNPVAHCITGFNKVLLPPSALLGSTKKPKHPHVDFNRAIGRVSVGCMALSLIGASSIEIYCAIGAAYSSRRTIGPPEKRIPILNFRTQQIPILNGIAHAYVLRAFGKWARSNFCDQDLDPRIRYGIAACSKVVSVQLSQGAAIAISERCGAQGLFGVNQMSRMHSEMRGIAMAEGDILGLSVRLAIELGLDRYVLPQSKYPDNLLARHERYLMKELKEALQATTHNHRGGDVDRQILPKCQALIEAIGHRMAHDAAVEAGVMPELTDLYVCSVVKLDSAWYCETGTASRQKQAEAEVAAYDAVLPHLSALVQGMNVSPYVTAPIVSDEAWEAYVSELSYQGSEADLIRARL